MIRPSIVTALLLVLTPALPASATSPRIFNGSPVPNADQSGMVEIFPATGGFCSGSLVANDWVVTAAHCDVTSGTVTDNQIYMGNQSGPYQYSRADFAVKPPSLDFALLHLQTAFTLNDSTTNYRLSPYPGSTFSLIGRSQIFYGYSDDGVSGPGTLRNAVVVGAGPFGAHNHGGTNASGQYSVAGDSGGPLVLESSGLRALTGILKCGFNECLARPETFRDWIYGQLYDRPMQFPNVWFLPFSTHPNLGAVPLENSYSNSATFTPCPDADTYSWSATYDLESGADTITVSTNLGPTVLTGVGTTSETGSGPMTVAIQTNATVRSPGLLALPITCGTGIRFANPWSAPPGPFLKRKTKWDPCPGGKPLTWSATYDFGSGDGYGKVDKTTLTGSGTITDVFAKKKVTVKIDTGASVVPGFQKLSAKCQAALICHELDCFTVPSTLPAATKLKTKWTPCGGASFQWQASYDVGLGTLAIKGKSATSKFVLTGAGQTDWHPGTGTLSLQLKTDDTSATAGLPELKAICDVWGTPPKVGIQLVEATYGRNCNVYYGNGTYLAATACNGLASCPYTVPTASPDPAPGCAKDFVATYTCGTSATVKSVTVAGEAAGGVASFTCP